MSQIKIVEISIGSWLRDIGRLRAEVWRGDGFDVPDLHSDDPEVWTDALDQRAHHWLAILDDVLVGAARLSLHKDAKEMLDFDWFDGRCPLPVPVASFNRLVVRQEARGLGIAKKLDAKRFEKAKELGAKTVCVVAVGERRSKAIEELGIPSVGQFPAGHGLIIPEQPMIGHALTI